MLGPASPWCVLCIFSMQPAAFCAVFFSQFFRILNCTQGFLSGSRGTNSADARWRLDESVVHENEFDVEEQSSTSGATTVVVL